jgi:hypothetical protein
MTKGKGMKSTARFLGKIIPILASCISLLFLCNDTNAQITSDELVLINSGMGGGSGRYFPQRFFTFYERESIEVNGDTVYVNTIDTVATVIVSATFGHLQDSSLELNTLKPCPIWITPY